MMSVVRRLVSVVAIAVICTSSLMAQRRYSPDFSVGVKAGATLGMMSFSPSPKQKFMQGVTAGIMARYMEENHFGLIAELNFTQRGWAEDFEGAPFKYKRTLSYIQLPLLTHIYFGSRRVRGFVNLGPEVGYMIGSSIDADFDYKNPTSVPGLPVTNRVTEEMGMEIKNRFDYGIAGGIGIEFLAGRNSFLLEGRYYYGLGNIYPSAKKDYFSASRGMSIEITLGYMFRLR